MPTKKFCSSFKTGAAPATYMKKYAVCSDFCLITQKWLVIHFFIKYKGNVFGFLGSSWHVPSTLQYVPKSKELDDAYYIWFKKSRP